MNTIEIGMRIKMQRQLLGYTREQLAEMVNITPRFCYDLELGSKKMSIDTLCRMRDALKISADYLLFGDSGQNDFEKIISMLQNCPKNKLIYLEDIISSYIAAFHEEE